MKRRGLRVFWYIIFCVVFGYWGKNISTAVEINDKFLQLPLATDLRVLQGWVYTVKVLGNLNHGAMDYDCEPGEQVYVASDGIAMSSRQISAVSGAGYGNFVFVKHTNGYATLYGHLSRTSEKVKAYPDSQKSNTNYQEWVKVEKGDYIGECGTSGTDNVHLHFEVTRGKYATGRVDSYDLYKTKQFYPPNASYTVLGEKHLWLHNPPQYLEAKIAENQTTETVVEKKSILDTVKNWFGSVVVSENIESNVGVQEKKEELGLSFVDKKILVSSNSGEDIRVIIKAKNTGFRVWKKQEMSLNIIGGREINSLFRHATWITDLRPALLDNTEVKPDETGSFSFSIRSLSKGVYSLKLMVVEVGSWKKVGVENIEIAVTVGQGLDDVSEELVSTSTPEKKKDNPFEGMVHGIKEFAETVVDKVVDVIKSVPKIFRGGGGSSSSSNENNQPVVDNPFEEPIVIEKDVVVEENVEVESIPEISREIIFNEIAWSGSSRVCRDREWIELYNPSSTVKSLENWTLDIYTSEVTSSVALTGSIEANGYYLISHADIFSLLITPDVVIPQHTQISNSGARLVLQNQDGEIIDVVDQSLGWTAGSAEEYPSTLERVASSTWKSSDSVRYGIQSGNCGQIAGSPRMVNNGFAFISDETLGFYPKNVEGKILLTQEENPYIFSSFTVPKNEVIEVGPGVVFAGISPESRIKVQGELVMKGEENNPIVITSRHDHEIIATSTLFSSIFTGGLAQAGDWQNIEVSEGGKLKIEYGVLKYGGNRFGTSAFCQGCSRSQVITNLGGEVVLQNVEIGNGFELGSGAGPDVLVYSNNGTLNLQNTKLHHGKRAINSEGNTDVTAKSVVVHDFDLLDKVIYVDRIMPVVWEDVDFLENTPSYAYSPALVVTSSYTLSPDHVFEFGTVLVDSGGELILDGGNLYAREITVNGTLRSEENERMSEIAGGVLPSSTFSRILFSVGSLGNLENIKIRGGGYFQSTSGYPFSSPRPYMIWIDGATVSISNSQLIDSRRPGGMVVVRNGNINIQDTELGWNSGYNKLSSFLEYGIVLNTQSIGHIENVNFKKMDYVVELNQGSTMTYDRMSKVNFIDLYPAFFPSKNWYPITLFPF